MNKTAAIFLAGALLFSVMTSYGFDKSSLQNPATKKAVITSLLIGLSSDNDGLRKSSAYMLGEIKATEAVIPLMKMLRIEKNEDGRIVAALALYKINDSRGVFAVKQAIKFDDSGRVRKMCTNFYNQTLRDRFNVADEILDSSKVAIK
ncbi:MAG TPA: HEAT repeat domain-containing protein [Ignavibacteriaceae bacterium]|nr:HEAT repeat domain-containing protein [Ignavibacteriaceae bacterium]